jgi:hypothetical protein
VISRKKFDKYKNDYPAFVISIIAHEFGHAKLFLTDEKCSALVPVFKTLIMENLPKKSIFGVFNEHDFSEEKAMDKFGKYVAEKIDLQEGNKKELYELIKDLRRNDINRLKCIIKWESSTDLSLIWNETIDLIKKDEVNFKEFLKKNEHSGKSLPECLSFEDFFKYR